MQPRHLIRMTFRSRRFGHFFGSDASKSTICRTFCLVSSDRPSYRRKNAWLAKGTANTGNDTLISNSGVRSLQVQGAI